MNLVAEDGGLAGLLAELPQRPLPRAAMRRPLELDVRSSGAGVVIALGGCAGMADADRLRGRLAALVAEGAELVVLDLSDLSFIGSSGLGAIMFARQELLHRNGKLRLAAPAPAVLSVIQQARLTKLLDIFDSVEEALGA